MLIHNGERSLFQRIHCLAKKISLICQIFFVHFNHLQVALNDGNSEFLDFSLDQNQEYCICNEFQSCSVYSKQFRKIQHTQFFLNDKKQ